MRAVPRANDLIAFDVSAGQLAAVVRADVLDGEVLPIQVEDDHLRPVDVHDPESPGRELLRAGDAHPIAQTAITSMSGSICRTRPSMPASVPESELGQLPQAPW